MASKTPASWDEETSKKPPCKAQFSKLDGPWRVRGTRVSTCPLSHNKQLYAIICRRNNRCFTTFACVLSSASISKPTQAQFAPGTLRRKLPLRNLGYISGSFNAFLCFPDSMYFFSADFISTESESVREVWATHPPSRPSLFDSFVVCNFTI